jgi:hypothetical protein
MKMVKSLLLGSAAGLVAVTAGQAADLPVKAKPVEYVKICSLYGAGFYYMPGTDMCIKVGGWVRTEAFWGNTNGNSSWGPFAGQENNRLTSNMGTVTRGYITADAREQTAYGTARAYIDVGLNTNDTGTVNAGSSEFSSNRAFIQWAGMTTGLTVSMYDFYIGAQFAYRASYIPKEDTSDPGWWLWAYTAQLGNGVSATISAEQRRTTQTVLNNVADSVPVNGGSLTSTSLTAAAGYGGMQVPDIVANLRVDQTWGSAQVMGVLHDVNANYYSTGTASTGSGHPSDAWGFVVGAGLRLNFPMVAQGDYFMGEVNYTHGAMRYIGFSNTTNFEAGQGNQEAWGINTDCVFGGGPAVAGVATNQTSCQLTTAWSLNAGYEHYWTPQWHESFYGGYEAVSYNGQANAMLCSQEGFGIGAGVGGAAIAGPGCNNNWSFYGVGSRLQWDVTKSFYLGVELVYNHMNSATTGSPTNSLVGGAGVNVLGLGAPNSPTTQVSNMNTWEGAVRIHKDFLP